MRRPRFIRLPATDTRQRFLDRYRELATGKDVLMYVYVTDAAGALKGVVDIREIVAAEPGQTLGDIMTEHVNRAAERKHAARRRDAIRNATTSARCPSRTETICCSCGVVSRRARSQPRLA